MSKKSKTITFDDYLLYQLQCICKYENKSLSEKINYMIENEVLNMPLTKFDLVFQI